MGSDLQTIVHMVHMCKKLDHISKLFDLWEALGGASLYSPTPIRCGRKITYAYAGAYTATGTIFQNM